MVNYVICVLLLLISILAFPFHEDVWHWPGYFIFQEVARPFLSNNMCVNLLVNIYLFIILIERHHQKQILFCDCEDDAVTLVKMHLWPSTVKRPVLAFHVKLIELLEALVIECHISLQKFCDMLNVINRSSLLPKWVINIEVF